MPRLLPAARVVLLASLLAACGQIPNPPAPSPTPTASPAGAGPSSAVATPEVSSPAPGTCVYTATGAAAKPVDPPPTQGVPTTGTVDYVATMTNGKVTITLDRAQAPCTVNSFVSLAEQGFYDKTKCHRLADSGIFILQCGDPTGTGRGGPGYVFPDELTGSESYRRGVVAMANSGPGTNGSQFFFVWDDSTSLDDTANYTVFGHIDAASRDVIAGMAAEGQDGTNGDGTGRPNNPSQIVSLRPKRVG